MSRTGLEDAYIMRGSKKLRMGYTTGSCAAAAARGAAFMLLSGKEIQEVKIHTPKGIVLNLELLDIRRSAEKVSCAVRKDGGDDPDVTDKALIYAEVTFGTEEGIVIDGGFGVGRVTKPRTAGYHLRTGRGRTGKAYIQSETWHHRRHFNPWNERDCSADERGGADFHDPRRDGNAESTG